MVLSFGILIKLVIMKYRIYNILENKTIFYGNQYDFIEFVKKIIIENENYDYSVIGLTDAIEYIEQYCSNLTLTNVK